MEPYGVADNNKSNPLLDDLVGKLRKDLPAKLAFSALKHKFVGTQEAYLHGDLHTGSLMCTPGSSLVIDPEFAFYGPIGFDVGSYLANLLLAFFAQVRLNMCRHLHTGSLSSSTQPALASPRPHSLTHSHCPRGCCAHRTATRPRRRPATSSRRGC
jgi:hypothetical protein